MTIMSALNPGPRVLPVNRDDQTGEFRAALERVRLLGSIFQTLFEWYGSPGIGKSTLVGLLRDVCHELSVPNGYVDFSQQRNERASLYKINRVALIEDLLNGFKDCDLTEVLQAIDAYTHTGADDLESRVAPVNAIVKTFIGFIIHLTEKSPVALFFDETERIDPDVADWLEEWIINPLVQRGKCLIVWTGRHPQRWKRFEVRRHLRIQELGVFDNTATANLLKLNSKHVLPEFSKQVLKMTGGHPMAETIVLNRLDALVTEGQLLQLSKFKSHEKYLLDGLVQDFVEDFAFRDFTPSLKMACRMLSLVRQFDVILLRKILSDTIPFFANLQRDEFGDVLTQLRTSQLVLWDDRRKGYTIDPTLRKIIGEHIRENQPSIYAQVNRLAIEVYQDWIERAGDNRGIYIVEELYQQACLNRLPKKVTGLDRLDLIALLKTRLNQYPQRDQDLRISALDRLYHELDEDHELYELAGDNKFSQLLDLARQARSGLVF